MYISVQRPSGVQSLISDGVCVCMYCTVGVCQGVLCGCVLCCVCRCVKYHLPDQVSGSTSERKDDFVAKAGSKTQALLKKGEPSVSMCTCAH